MYKDQYLLVKLVSKAKTKSSGKQIDKSREGGISKQRGRVNLQDELTVSAPYLTQANKRNRVDNSGSKELAKTSLSQTWSQEDMLFSFFINSITHKQSWPL